MILYLCMMLEQQEKRLTFGPVSFVLFRDRCLHKFLECCERDTIFPSDLERSQLAALDHAPHLPPTGLEQCCDFLDAQLVIHAHGSSSLTSES